MKINFKYDDSKDIWCLLNYGKSSSNSSTPTKVYGQLVSEYGENPTEKDTNDFITHYLFDNQIDIDEYLKKYKDDWEAISDEYKKRAENIFKVELPKDIVVYLTVNNRCPYSIEENFFFVSIPSNGAMKTVMHELWHFYTWYGIGIDQEEKLGKQKYNDLKEALTVLLNVECKDLLPHGVIDVGYPQHQKIREEILDYWEKDRNIQNLWNYLAKLDS